MILNFHSIYMKGFQKAYKIYSAFLSAVDTSLVDSEVDCIYFCGNSLGLQPKQAGILVNQELDKWQQMYVCTMYNSIKMYILV